MIAAFIPCPQFAIASVRSWCAVLLLIDASSVTITGSASYNNYIYTNKKCLLFFYIGARYLHWPAERRIGLQQAILQLKLITGKHNFNITVIETITSKQ